MVYNVLVSGKHVPGEVLPFLARVFDVPPDRVSVRDEDDEDSWDWDHISRSLVTCEYSRVRGDLAWCLTLYAVDGDVPEPPHALVANFEDEVMYVPLPNPVTDHYLPETRGHLCCAKPAVTSPSGSG